MTPDIVTSVTATEDDNGILVVEVFDFEISQDPIWTEEVVGDAEKVGEAIHHADIFVEGYETRGDVAKEGIEDRLREAREGSV
jgi:hypothetical protein